MGVSILLKSDSQIDPQGFSKFVKHGTPLCRALIVIELLKVTTACT
jgi:hypothetical protein